MPNLFTFIIQIVVVGAVSRRVGWVMRVHQPRVIGEMIAGLLLRPSLLGWLAPDFSRFLFPPSILAYLSALSQIGLVIFMFLIGLRIDLAELREQRRLTVAVGQVSIAIPFVFGVLLVSAGIRGSRFRRFRGVPMAQRLSARHTKNARLHQGRQPAERSIRSNHVGYREVPSSASKGT